MLRMPHLLDASPLWLSLPSLIHSPPSRSHRTLSQRATDATAALAVPCQNSVLQFIHCLACLLPPCWQRYLAAYLSHALLIFLRMRFACCAAPLDMAAALLPAVHVNSNGRYSLVA